MTIFDARHRWGPVIQSGATITRVCRACGRTASIETLVPTYFVDLLVQNLRRPNPYRSLVA